MVEKRQKENYKSKSGKMRQPWLGVERKGNGVQKYNVPKTIPALGFPRSDDRCCSYFWAAFHRSEDSGPIRGHSFPRLSVSTGHTSVLTRLDIFCSH